VINKPLYECLHPAARNVLAVCGLMWKPEQAFCLLHVWNYTVYISSCFIFAYILIHGSILGGNTTSAKLDTIEIIPCFFQTVGFTVIFMQSRKKCLSYYPNKLEIQLYYESLSITYVVFLFCLLLTLVLVVDWIFFPEIVTISWVYAPILISLLMQSLLISGSLLYLFVDGKCISAVIDRIDLTIIHSDCPNLEAYETLYQDILDRVSKASIYYNIIMITAILDIIGLLVCSFFFSLDYLLIPVAVIMKEVIYCVFGFWCVANVNEKAQKLIKRAGSSTTSNKKNLSRDMEKRMLRMELFGLLYAKPISFPLAGMVLTRKDVIIRTSIWSLGFAIGLLKEKLLVGN
jgi:hypothetical protein